MKLPKLGSHRETHQVCLGMQDQLKLISYSGLKEERDYLVIDNQFVRCLFISGYPFVAHSGWVDELINFNHDADLSFHIEEVGALSALPKLNRKITELESTKRAMLKAGRIVGSEITDPLESAIELKDKIQRGQEKLFLLSINIALRTSSLESLNKQTTVLESLLASKLFYVKTAYYQQLEALQSVLPRCEDSLNQKRNLDSSSAALSFPFISSELVQPSGILYGVNKHNNSLVMLDRFSLNNANSITFAQSGSGKSYAAKVEILRQLMQGVDVIVIDPEREYLRLAGSVDGTLIRLSADSKSHINPFDLGAEYGGQKAAAAYVQDLIEIISLMCEGLTPREKAVADKAVLQTFRTSQKRQPLIEDFYRTLLELDELKLAERLEKFVSGSLSSTFNQQTTVDLNNRLVVFDIKEVPDSLRQIMTVVIANYVQHRVRGKPKKRLLVIDEGWMLLEHEESARFIANLVRRSRKNWLGVAIISQQANDFLNSPYGQAIASQSALRILMRQDTTTIAGVVEHFGLSEYEKSFLFSCGKGDALMIADLHHIAVSVVAAASEHPLITTDPREIYGQ